MKNKELRNEIACLIAELRAIGAKRYDLCRSFSDVKHIIRHVSHSTYGGIHEQVLEWSIEQNIQLNEIYSSYETETSYDGWDEEILVLVSYIPETDQQYYSRLWTLKGDLITKQTISSTEWSTLFHSINSDLYVARNITLSESKVIDCLTDLDRIHNSLNYDHNGQASDFDMLLKQRSVYQELKAKYL
jgi:hypothetical protein